VCLEKLGEALAAGKSGKREQNSLNTRKTRLEKAQQKLDDFLATKFLDLPVSPVTKTGAAFEGNFPTDAGAVEWIQATQGVNLSGLERVRKTKKTIERLEEIMALVYSQDGELTYRLHCNLKRGTSTGRLSAATPNLQNIPKDKRKDKYNVRELFVATPGYKLVVADYSQLEMRVMAHILELVFDDTKLKEDLLAADAHSSNAVRVFGGLRQYMVGVTADQVKHHPDPRVRQTRDDIKAVTYGFVYGKSPIGLGASLKDEHGRPIGETEAQKVMDGFLSLYPALVSFTSLTWDCVRAGKVYTIGGRGKDIERISRAEYRAALNLPAQGSASDIIDRASLNCCRRLKQEGLSANLILSVHDELIFEVQEDHAELAAKIVEHEMRNAWKLLCPLDVECKVGATWAECK
jgi:DNA polymerase-1